MTLEILLVLAILLISLVFFITEKVRMDIVALLVLSTLALTGLVSPADAMAGFSNPAVITVWAMFILSEGLTNTGIAGMIGGWVMKISGHTEVRLIAVIMFTAGVLSAIMNNIGVAALMLPVVVAISRKTGVAKARLLLPLAYGSLLGGLTTLIGTPPNLLVSEALREQNLKSFGFFDYTPVGACVMIAGIVFVAFWGRRLLPSRDPAQREMCASEERDPRDTYALAERTFILELKSSSPLAGKTIDESRLGRALGFTVIALERGGRTILSPDPGTKLIDGDQLITQGRAERLDELRGWHDLRVSNGLPEWDALFAGPVKVGEFTIAEGASIAGETLRECAFKNRFNLHVLLVRREGSALRRDISRLRLQEGDRLLIQGAPEAIEAARGEEDFSTFSLADDSDLAALREIQGRLFEVEVAPESNLVGNHLREIRLREAFDLHILSIERENSEILLPEADEIIQAGDKLTIHGRREDLETVRGLQQLGIEEGEQPDLRHFESGRVRLVEAILAPRSTLAGKTPADLDFRNRYGIQLLGVWRENRALRSNLGNLAFQFGDAFLLMGPRKKLLLLEEEADFILLHPVAEKFFRRERALLAAMIMTGVLIPAILGWAPIAVTAVAGVAFMVLAGCLSMEEAYRAIDWKSVFLIAGMLPLGTALQDSGAAAYLTDIFMSKVMGFGPWAVIFGLYMITALATTVIPTAALVVLMSPIVLKACFDMGVSPQTGMMAVAMAASASFTSPISHPANLLVMGPGGYRFADYLKLGIPLAFVVMIATFLVLPVFWPLHP